MKTRCRNEIKGLKLILRLPAYFVLTNERVIKSVRTEGTKMRAKANYTSLGLMFVHPYLSNPETCFGFSSFEKQTTNKDHENQLGNLSFFFFCCRKHFIFHTHKKIDASSSFLCFVQGEKSFTLFLCSKKEEEKKNAILGKKRF